MNGVIQNYNFLDMEAQKYWSFPSSYDKSRKQEQLNLMLYSDEYLASEKKDGYWEMLLKDSDGNIFMRARAKGVKGWICKEKWVPHLQDFFDNIPNGSCLLTEVYLPGKTSKSITSILGCKEDKAIQRQKETGFLRMYIFDVLAWDNNILLNTPIINRKDYLKQLPKHEYVDIAEYWTSPNDIHTNWLRILSNGGEGVVLTKKNYCYSPGQRTARMTLKLKKELEEYLDVFLTGRWKEAVKEYRGDCLDTWQYWYDELKEERVFGDLGSRINNDSIVPVNRLWFKQYAAAIEIALIINNKVTPIGYISGIPDDIREDIVKNSDKWKGRVVEVQAMEIDSSGDYPTLRHAKIINWRAPEDKKWTDCVWGK